MQSCSGRKECSSKHLQGAAEGQAKMGRVPSGQMPPSGPSQISLEEPSLVTPCAYDICP